MSVEPTTTTDEAKATAWLRAQGLPAARWFRRAAVLLAASSLAVLVQWAAFAALVQVLFDSGSTAIPTAIGVLVVAGVTGVVLRHFAQRATDAGRSAIIAAVRAALLDVVLPSGPAIAERADRDAGQGMPRADPATVAGAVLELADDVADYHAGVGPLHRAAPVTMGLILVAVAIAHWPIAVLLIVASALMPMNMRLVGLVAAEESRRQLRATQRLAATVLDNFRGMRTIRTLGAGDRQRHRLERTSNALNAETSRVLRKAFLSGFVMDAVVTFAIAVCATTVGFELLGYVQIPGTAPLTLGAGLFVLILCPMYFLPIRQIASGYHDRDRAMAAAEVLCDVVPMDSRADAPQARRTEVTGIAASGEVSSAVTVLVRDLTCRFEPERRSVLESVTLDLPAGSWTAITGATGSGKTTLLSMIAGLGRPTSGTVAWQDPTTRALIAPNIEAVSWLGQRSVVLEGTIAENIRFGDPDATDAAVRAAAATAGLLRFIDSLPAGMETKIGDGGWGISAGQTRAIAIARAVLRDTGLWILDEPTAHLDPVTELAVLRALRSATSERTVVIATHSVAVLAVVDRQVDLSAASARVKERGAAV